MAKTPVFLDEIGESVNFLDQQRSPSIIMFSCTEEAGLGIDSSLQTCSMDGRERGVSFKQAKANMATDTISSVIGYVGGESHWSKTSFNNKFFDVEPIDEEDGENKEEIRSPGCCPNTTSKVITP
ncbi:hypothetical protein O6P43_032172 [Quillaja saponaria]|uniref:Uncharacterized protein n=1 Tax=Quillaja saponaria TaxID=32244 RepID=A0AAD7KYA9_QUISA|nr:hypothetical protein O6P43_032172 [Quillaja saponaria]